MLALSAQMFRGDLGAGHGQDNPEIVLRLEREDRTGGKGSDGLRLQNRFGLRLDWKTPPEAAPIKCAGRESAGLPALSHTGHTEILLCRV